MGIHLAHKIRILEIKFGKFETAKGYSEII